MTFPDRFIPAGLALALSFLTMPAISATGSTAPTPAIQATGEAATPPSGTLKRDETVKKASLRLGHGDPVAGEAKAALCFGCHGINGSSTETVVPKLAGQYADYIVKEVRNFRTLARKHQIMNGIALSIREEDVVDIAAYFASKPIMQADQPTDNTAGKKLFEHGDPTRTIIACMNCHGDDGRGRFNENPTFPVIGGQHKDYLLKQLTRFKQGDRENSPGGIMNITTQKLDDAELEALANYIAGL